MTVVENLASHPELDAMEQRFRAAAYFERIGRPEIGEVLTPQSPWSYWTMEIYRPPVVDGKPDIKGQGGLGMLASDTLEAAKKLGVPMLFVTPFYTRESQQVIENGRQRMVYQNITPEDRGFEKFDTVTINTRGYYGEALPPTALDVHLKEEDSVRILTISEPAFGELYAGAKDGDHRMYQQVALGFGGYKALRLTEVNPAMNQQLNEAPTVFAALARLDQRVKELDGNFDQALVEIRATTIYTNHTLVPAVEGEFSRDQIERFVIPNIDNARVQDWVRSRIDKVGGDKIRLSTLAVELAGKMNGVSLIHAREASKMYRDSDNRLVTFEGVTNGISVDRWGDPALIELYRQAGVLDGFDLPAPGFEENIQALDESELETIKDEARTRMRDYLRTRTDQNGMSINIPEGDLVFDWRRRIADYKRPEMMFEDLDRLAEILQNGKSHLVMAGKAHSTDYHMQYVLERIIRQVNDHPILKDRVHFVTNYDEPLAEALVQGADVSINTPIVRNHENGESVSTEACGTSWEKDILNNVILISTDDGGVADLTVAAETAGIEGFEPPYLRITGHSYAEEVASLYAQMEKATRMVHGTDETSKHDYLKKQLIAYLPVISGSRMLADYTNLAFPVAA